MEKQVVVNIMQQSNMWTNIAMGCKASFYVIASVFLILCIICLFKRIKNDAREKKIYKTTKERIEMLIQTGEFDFIKEMSKDQLWKILFFINYIKMGDS